MSSAQTTPLTEEALPDLSAFLLDAFPEPGHRHLFAPDVLRWKYLEPIGDDTSVRSWLVREGGRIVAHLGLYLTRFGPATAAFPYDWIAKGTKSPHGLMLLLRMHRTTDIQYILGCTEEAAQVYARSGYRSPTVAPLFQKILQPIAWRHIHRFQPLWKKAILLSIDRSRSLANPGRTPRHPVTLRPVTSFGSEIAGLLAQGPPVLCSGRDPALLNHFLKFPPGTIRGWEILEQNRLIGFALVNTVQAGAIRLGKILECWLGTSDADRWHAATAAVVDECRRMGCHQIAAYGTAPWMAAGLRAAGFFERGHTPLQWRDPKGQVTIDRPFHLTYLEADIGLL